MCRMKWIRYPSLFPRPIYPVRKLSKLQSYGPLVECCLIWQAMFEQQEIVAPSDATTRAQACARAHTLTNGGARCSSYNLHPVLHTPSSEQLHIRTRASAYTIYRIQNTFVVQDTNTGHRYTSVTLECNLRSRRLRACTSSAYGAVRGS